MYIGCDPECVYLYFERSLTEDAGLAKFEADLRVSGMSFGFLWRV
jgi:hypothetical protein